MREYKKYTTRTLSPLEQAVADYRRQTTPEFMVTDELRTPAVDNRGYYEMEYTRTERGTIYVRGNNIENARAGALAGEGSFGDREWDNLEVTNIRIQPDDEDTPTIVPIIMPDIEF